MKIKQIDAREILDSRGNPTIECTVTLENGMKGRGAVPSGASVGRYEAVELRDKDPNRFNGKGVLQAIDNITTRIAPALIGKQADIQFCDTQMLELDGTPHKSSLGANAILAVSLAVVRAQALFLGQETYEVLQTFSGVLSGEMPKAMYNILNGGVHADNKIYFQEFMIMPIGFSTFFDRLHTTVLVYNKLKTLLRDAGLSTSIGDEGGFAPRFINGKRSREQQALDFLLRAVEAAGFEPGKDIVFCLDVAASQFYSKEEGCYLLYKEKLRAHDLVDEYKKLIDEYPIYSIEDGLDEDDWEGWKIMTEELGKKVLLVGDDIFVSNPSRIERGIRQGVANSVLIKPNQIGSVTECLDAITLCKKHDYDVVVSHRSGETCDSFISDLVFGTASPYFKAGAPVRGERVAKYNRLLEIGG